MKFLLLALIVAVCNSIATAEDDLLDQAVTKCLNKLDLSEAEDISEQEGNCLIGCLMQEFKLIDADGKLLPNGIEDFINTLPSQYASKLPNLSDDLTQLKPDLEKATDSCDAGRILSPIIGGLSETEFVEDNEESF